MDEAEAFGGAFFLVVLIVIIGLVWLLGGCATGPRYEGEPGVGLWYMQPERALGLMAGRGATITELMEINDGYRMGFSPRLPLYEDRPDGPQWAYFVTVDENRGTDRPRVRGAGLIGYGVDIDSEDPHFRAFYDGLCQELAWRALGSHSTWTTEDRWQGRIALTSRGEYMALAGAQAGENIATYFLVSPSPSWVEQFFIESNSPQNSGKEYE